MLGGNYLKYAEIIIDHKASKVDRPFTYQIHSYQEDDVEVGVRVVVPFGNTNKPTLGIVIRKSHTTPIRGSIKHILQVLDAKPIISKDMISLANWIREEYLCTLFEALSVILPPGDYRQINNIIVLKENYKNEEVLDNEEIMILELLKDHKQISYTEIKENSNLKNLNKNLISLEKKGIIFINIDVKKSISIKYEKILTKNKEIPFQDGLDLIGNSAKKQRLIWETKWDKCEKTEKEILIEFNTSTSVVKELLIKGLLVLSKEVINENPLDRPIPNYEKIKLNKDQDLVFNKIIKSDFNNYLIHGITGSGKTEVYLQLVEEYLNMGKDSIVLVPEISLTPQTIDRFVGRFGNRVAILHSRLTKAQRFSEWRRIKTGEYKIAIGARSAVFAPFNNLGLIIIDEEHENTYKSSNNPKYDTIEVARKRVEIEGGKLVLGTATPSIETYYKSYKKEYRYLELKERATKMKLPDIEVIDMRSELQNGNKSIFSISLKEKIDLKINNNEQVILFLNRRGYAGFVTCRTCGYVVKCENCDISMTLHKSNNILRCHYCGATKKIPKLCPKCSSEHIRTFGIGTEKIEEEVRKAYPHARVARMDSDTIKKRQDYDYVLNRMKERKIDILIGTQMITKGLDFPNVTLVGIIAADTTLNLPDFRSAEKSFQLITQVSGRAGRGEKNGSVVLQTYNPDHYSITSAKNNSYRDFYDMEISLRKEFLYPPFVNIISILFYGRDQELVKEGINRANEVIKNKVKSQGLKNILVNNPLPAPLERINNEYRYLMLIKYDEKISIDLKNLIKEQLILDKARVRNKGIKMSITINQESVL